jgi:Na+/melibiose symporter-like transporter
MASLPLAAAVAPPTRGRALAAYAGLGLPLAMMALPVYVLLPQFYAQATGLALATIGGVLLATRLLDALVDPWLGVWADALRRRSNALRPVLIACVPLALGFLALFNPPAGLDPSAATLWLAGALVAAYLGYSAASVAYQAWGAALAHDDAGRTRITAAREGAGLVGVVAASIVPYAAGAPALVVLFFGSLAAALVLLARAPQPPAPAKAALGAWATLRQPLASTRLRWLLAVFAVNGIATAVPATLVVFFVADRLELESATGLFLAAYFIAGAASMPLWSRLAHRLPLPAVWLAGMLLSIVAFIGAYWLGAGDRAAFVLVCVLSGLALGADLAVPPALLARVIDADGAGGRAEATYFGLWNFVNKLNLALAAGIALPALQALGYTSGVRSPAALDALALAYALIPCAIKLAAAGLLAWCWQRSRF